MSGAAGILEAMSAIRALAEELGRRSDDDLRRLLTVRPDLVLPPVPDLAALAARASTRVSLQRALENITRPQLQVLEAVTVLHDGGPVPLARLGTAVPGHAAGVLEEILDELVDRALCTGSAAEGILPAGAMAEALGPYPAGLGRTVRTLARTVPRFGPALVGAVRLLEPMRAHEAMTSAAAVGVLESVTSDPQAWAHLIEEAPDAAVALLRRLQDSPVGSTGSEAGDAIFPAVQWLLDRGLLAPLDALHVELPRDVGMALRGQAIVGKLETTRPLIVDRTTRAGLRDNAAHSAIAETLRRVTALLGVVAATPVATLRSGGVGVRELRRVREILRADDAEAVWLLELAAAVGLIVLDPDDSRWKTSGLEAWEAIDRDAQWLALVEGWLALDRAPALVGSRLPDGAAVNALAAEASRPDAPMVRRRFLGVATELSGVEGPDGAAANGSLPILTEQSVVDLATWHQPRLHRRFARLLPGMLAEAASLGLVGGGALTDAGMLVAEGRLDEAMRRVRDALPAPVAYVVLQADLTAVAPGYLQPDVARGLLRMSSPEGQGPATTYRFSADSVRAALDAGEDATTILAFLSTHSVTEIPQALTYLVEDTAARYRSLRVGRAGSYLRTEDDAVVAAVLADPRSGVLGVVQVAPTVLVSPASPQELTALLKDLGLTPAPDAVAGTAQSRTSAPRGTPAAPVGGAIGHLRSHQATWTVTEEEIADQVTVLRSARQNPSRVLAGSAGETLMELETLHSAIRSRSRISLGTADSGGNHERQVLVPLSVSGGRLRVFDPQRQVEKVVSVHRIMDVEILEGGPADG